jgi:yecA family protein
MMMFAPSIETALARLADSPGVAATQACLDRSSATLMQIPEDGNALVRALGGAEQVHDKIDDLLQILSAALEGAQMTQEKGQARGGVLIAALEKTVAQLTSEGALTTYGSLSLSRAWVWAGLVPPVQLGSSEEFPDESELGPLDTGQAEAMIDEVFGDLIEQAEGDVAAVHGTLTEMLPSLPVDVRAMIITSALTRPDEIFGRLGCAFLLDPAQDTRLAAAQGLAARLAAGHLEAEVAAQLVILRSWLPKDAARTRIDTLLRDAMRQGVSGGAITKPWKVHKVLATLPDGTGAQSIGVSIQSGSRRAMAMLLLKQDFGVKDAYVIPCTSASDQREIIASLEADTGALPVSPSYLATALELALDDGLSRGLPPAAGLVEIAEVCGLTGLRPQNQTTSDLLSKLDSEDHLVARSPQARGRLINASLYWLDDHPLIDSWFEDSDASRNVLDKQRAPRAIESALWKWLETRCDWWARIIARSAMLLQAGGHDDAESFIATAQSLLEGRALRKIPIMREIHEQTIGAWMYGDGVDGAIDPEIDLHMLKDTDDLPSPPAPEKKGELARLLKGSPLSPDSIDGYLAAICIAPKMITPDRWLTPVLNAALPAPPAPSLQRFLDLLLLRYNATLTNLADPKDLVRTFKNMNSPGQRDWCEGFLEGRQNFKTSWPAKSLSPNDRAMLRQIETMADNSAAAASVIPVLAAWLSGRLDAVNG